MAKRIAVFTGTRAEYGLMYWLMKDIDADPDLQLGILVSGAHLSPEFGSTYEIIERDGFEISEKIEILLSSDSAQGTAKSIGLGVVGYADALTRMNPDILVVLGDRFEALAAAQTAMILRIPIVHLHGGESSEGAYDDCIRHAITKMSYLHCTSTEKHRRRVIQLGENPARVANVGAIGLDHLARTSLMSKKELGESLSFELKKPYFIVTYHPVTLGDEPPLEAFQALLDCLDHFGQFQVIMTYPNADDGGRRIIPMIEEYAAARSDRVLSIPSLGQRRYLSAVSHAAAVVGNSSSGIIEVPSFGVPTVNIGLRQKGRTAAKSVISCGARFDSIKKAIQCAVSGSYSSPGEAIVNPYFRGGASERVISFIKSQRVASDLVKPFFDVEFQ